MGEWLTEEEQYKDVLSNEQILKIRDSHLREIRMRHWQYRHKIFLDEQNISDQELCRLADADYEAEMKEIEAYRNSLKK